MANASQQDIIKKFMYSLDKSTTSSGKTALDNAVKYASGGRFSNITKAINQMLSDCKNYGADDFLKEKCGIIIGNDDTGAITGFDAGGSTIKTAESIVPESGSLDTSFNASSFKADGLTFRLYKTENLSSDELYIWRALKTWWADESLNLIKESYGYSFTDKDASVKEITVTFADQGHYLASTDYPQYINGHYTRKLTINKTYFNNFKSSDVNGNGYKENVYLDRTIAHELTHAVMMSKIKCFKDLPQFITEGTAELTHGIDDLRDSVIRSLAKDYEKLSKAVSFKSGSGNTNAYVGGYIFLRYLAKQSTSSSSSSSSSTDNSDKVTVKGSVLTVAKNYNSNKLDLTNYSSSVKKVDATALTKGIMILGNKNANSIAAGSGNDTLSGGAGNDTLTGGNGKDIFIYTSGKDTVTDYATGDKISLGSSISNAKLSGSNVVLTVGSGTLTVKNAKEKTLTIIDSSGKEYTTVVGGSTVTVTNRTSSPVTVDSAVKIIDASSRTTAVKITGNSKANTISGGSKADTIYGGSGNDSLVGNAGNDKLYGGAGSDTLWGGKGNDSLWGDAGSDKFIYHSGEGKDIIFGFDSKDTLTLDNLNFTSSYSKSKGEVVLKIGSGSVTFKDFTTSTFHINNATYKISNGNFVKK